MPYETHLAANPDAELHFSLTEAQGKPTGVIFGGRGIPIECDDGRDTHLLLPRVPYDLDGPRSFYEVAFGSARDGRWSILSVRGTLVSAHRASGSIALVSHGSRGDSTVECTTDGALRWTARVKR